MRNFSPLLRRGQGDIFPLQATTFPHDFLLTFLVSWFDAKANLGRNYGEFWSTQHVVLTNATRCLRPRMPSSWPGPRLAGRRANFGSTDNQMVNFSGFAGDGQNLTY